MRIRANGSKVLATLIAGLLFGMGFSYVPSNASSTADVSLGASANYSLVSGGVMSLGATTLYTGVSPVQGACQSCNGTQVTNFATAGLTMITDSATATSVVNSVQSAKTLIMGLTKTFDTSIITTGDLAPGVYETTDNAALNITTSFALDGGGDYSSVFIFRTTAAMDFTAGIAITFKNGAQPSNIYWVSGAAMTTGATTTIPGNLIAGAALTTGASSIVNGSVLGLGAVTLGASSKIVHDAVIAQPLPGAPTSLSATAGSAQVALTWLAPSSNGGKPITDYLVEYAANAGGYTTFIDGVSSTTSSTVTGLNNTTLYTFRISAITSAGTGPTSATASATPTDLLGAPIFLVATPGNAQVALTWLAPSSNGGSAITDYLVERSTNGTTFTIFEDEISPATSATVTGLVNGTQYIFRVSAVAASVGPASASASATPKTTPEAPAGLSKTTASARVVLTWTIPVSDGGSAITDYIVQYSTDATNFLTFADGVSTTTSATVTGLINETAYTLRVSAINAIGTGASSVVVATPSPSDVEIETARLAALAAENARVAAEVARSAAIARDWAIAAENARVAAATAEAARLAEIARAAVLRAAQLAAIEAERARLALVAHLAELERLAACDSTITNIQYSQAAAGSSVGQLSWTTTGTGVFQYFGDTFLYPAFMQYGIYTANWNGYLLNLVPGVRYQVSVNYLADCGRISGVSTTIMNDKVVALTVPTPEPSPNPFPTPAPSLILQIPIPEVTIKPPPIEITRPRSTKSPTPIVTVISSVFETVTMKPTSATNVHVVLRNLIPGQQVKITLRKVQP